MNITSAPAVEKMANIYDNSLVRYWHLLFHDLSDPRTQNWFLLSSPVPGLSILIGYHYFVHSWGPKYMEHRKPFQMKNILVVYNFFQVILSTYIFVKGLSFWSTKYSWKCEPVDFSETPEAIAAATAVYIYFLAKLTELLDTVFFVLRKKDSQITFLHLYHHTVMPMISWGASKYYPGGHGTLIGFINSFVHILMYTYYLLAALLPQYQQYLWWKKYITTLQMGQFCIAFLHSSQLLFYDCGYPRWSVFFTLPNAVFFYVLFNDFYKNAYEAKKKTNLKLSPATTPAVMSNGKIEANGSLSQPVKNDLENTSKILNGRISVKKEKKED